MAEENKPKKTTKRTTTKKKATTAKEKPATTAKKRKSTGAPLKEFDKKTFEDLVGLGCTQKEICWFFREPTGKSANVDTLSRWCVRTYGMNYAEYSKEYGGIARNITLRQNQLKLSAHSAPMAIFLGKNYLGQRDCIEVEDNTAIERLDDILKELKEDAFKEVKADTPKQKESKKDVE